MFLVSSGRWKALRRVENCRVASERCRGLLHEHRAALCAGEKTAHRFSQISKIYLSKKVTSLSYIFSFTSITVRKSLRFWRLKVKVLFHFSFTFWQRDR